MNGVWADGSRRTMRARREGEVAIALARPRSAKHGIMLVHNDPQEYTRQSRLPSEETKSGLGGGKIS
jgi:hypothetical protein